MIRRRPIFILLALLALPACGKVDFKVGDDKDRADKDLSDRLLTVNAPLQPLKVTPAGQSLVDNDLFATQVRKLTAAYSYAPAQPETLTLQVSQSKTEHCGSDNIKPKFTWRTTPTGGETKDSDVTPGDNFEVQPGGDQQLVIEMSSDYGFCKQMQVTFSVRAQAH